MKNRFKKIACGLTTVIAAQFTATAVAQPLNDWATGLPRGLYSTAMPIKFEGTVTTMQRPVRTTANGTTPRVGRTPGFPSVTTTSEVQITRTKVNAATIIQAMIDDGAFTSGMRTSSPLDPKKMQIIYFQGFDQWLGDDEDGLYVVSPQLPQPVPVPKEFLTLRLSTPVAYSKFSETLPRPNPSATPNRSPFPYTSSFTQGGTDKNVQRGWIGIEGYVLGVPFDGAVRYSAVQRTAKQGSKPVKRPTEGLITYPPIYLEEILKGNISGFATADRG